MTHSAYFRKLFKERPGLLDDRTSDQAVNLWMQDHPESEETLKVVRAVLLNVKVAMRKERTKRTKRALHEPGKESHP